MVDGGTLADICWDVARVPNAVHESGKTQTTTGAALDNSDWWYTQTFLPKTKNYRKGALVWDPNKFYPQASNENIQR
jgi:chitin synthase